jgi:hypothetical protein
MKTITKKLAVLGVMAVGLVGCAENNEKNVMTDPNGVPQTGVTPPSASRSSSDFANKNKSKMEDPKVQAEYVKGTK